MISQYVKITWNRPQVFDFKVIERGVIDAGYELKEIFLECEARIEYDQAQAYVVIAGTKQKIASSNGKELRTLSINPVMIGQIFDWRSDSIHIKVGLQPDPNRVAAK